MTDEPSFITPSVQPIPYDETMISEVKDERVFPKPTIDNAPPSSMIKTSNLIMVSNDNKSAYLKYVLSMDIDRARGEPSKNSTIRKKAVDRTSSKFMALGTTSSTFATHSAIMDKCESFMTEVFEKKLSVPFDIDYSVGASTCAMGIKKPTHNFLTEFGMLGDSKDNIAQININILAEYVSSWFGSKKDFNDQISLSFPRGKNQGWPFIISGIKRRLTNILLCTMAVISEEVRKNVISDIKSSNMFKLKDSTSLANKDRMEEDNRDYLNSINRLNDLVSAYKSSARKINGTGFDSIDSALRSADLIKHHIDPLITKFGFPIFASFSRLHHSSKKIPFSDKGMIRTSSNFECRVRAVFGGGKIFAIMVRPLAKKFVKFYASTDMGVQDRKIIGSFLTSSLDNKGKKVIADDNSKFDQRHGRLKLIQAIHFLLDWAKLKGCDDDELRFFSGAALWDMTLPYLNVSHNSETFATPSSEILPSGGGLTTSLGIIMNIIDSFALATKVYGSLDAAIKAHKDKKWENKGWGDDSIKVFDSGDSDKWLSSIQEYQKELGFVIEPEPTLKYLGRYYSRKTGDFGHIPLARVVQSTIFPERQKLQQAMPIAIKVRMDMMNPSFVNVQKIYPLLRDLLISCCQIKGESLEDPTSNLYHATRLPLTYSDLSILCDDMLKNPSKYSLDKDLSALDDVIKAVTHSLEDSDLASLLGDDGSMFEEILKASSITVRETNFVEDILAELENNVDRSKVTEKSMDKESLLKKNFSSKNKMDDLSPNERVQISDMVRHSLGASSILNGNLNTIFEDKLVVDIIKVVKNFNSNPQGKDKTEKNMLLFRKNENPETKSKQLISSLLVPLEEYFLNAGTKGTPGRSSPGPIY